MQKSTSIGVTPETGHQRDQFKDLVVALIIRNVNMIGNSINQGI